MSGSLSSLVSLLVLERRLLLAGIPHSHTGDLLPQNRTEKSRAFASLYE